MQLSSLLDQLHRDLANLGKLGGTDLEQAVERLIPPLEPVLHTRVLDMLTTLAGELSLDLPTGRVETRINGDEFTLAFIGEEPAPRDTNSDLDARISLRLPTSLKERIEASASREGISLNTWILRALDRNPSTPTFPQRQLRGRGRS
jgi:hypothetical protein